MYIVVFRNAGYIINDFCVNASNYACCFHREVGLPCDTVNKVEVLKHFGGSLVFHADFFII